MDYFCKHFKKIILIGNLRDYGQKLSKSLPLLNSNLCRLLMKFSGEIYWLITQDLDHEVFDLLHGLKTPCYKKRMEISMNIKTILSQFTGVIWYGENLIQNEHIYNIGHEFHTHWPLERIKDRTKILNRTTKFIKENYFKRIEYVHAVSDNSLNLAKLLMRIDRKYDLALIGTKYNMRIYAEYYINQQKELTIAPFEHFDFRVKNLTKNATRVMRRIGLSTTAQKTFGRKIRFASQELLYAKSKFAWMDPGYFGYFVRKYLESAIMGSALVGISNDNFRNLGLVNNLNFLEVHAEEIHKTNFTDILNECNDRELASNMLTMIRKNHSSSARANQILQSIECEKKIYRAHFLNGNFVIE